MLAKIGPVVALAMVVGAGSLSAQARRPELPAGDGKDLTQGVCGTACHDATPLLMKRDGENGWRENVERMVVQKGAQLFPGELEIVVRYLSTRLGPGTALMQTGSLPPGALSGGAASAKEIRLPDGVGKEAVQLRCTVCHDLGRVVTTGRTRPEWEQITRNMLKRGPRATPEQALTIVTYLATRFPKAGE